MPRAKKIFLIIAAAILAYAIFKTYISSDPFFLIIGIFPVALLVILGLERIIVIVNDPSDKAKLQKAVLSVLGGALIASTFAYIGLKGTDTVRIFLLGYAIAASLFWLVYGIEGEVVRAAGRPCRVVRKGNKPQNKKTEKNVGAEFISELPFRVSRLRLFLIFVVVTALVVWYVMFIIPMPNNTTSTVVHAGIASLGLYFMLIIMSSEARRVLLRGGALFFQINLGIISMTSKESDEKDVFEAGSGDFGGGGSSGKW